MKAAIELLSIKNLTSGIELLSALPRGSGGLGFYEKPEQYVPIRSVRLAADVPAAERTPIRLLRTDTATWNAYVAARRNRSEDFFVKPAGHIDLCNVPIPERSP